ncbi:MAG: restriction endonuclease subunit R, partial [Opitutaceae bacterium]
GRGTRPHDHSREAFDPQLKADTAGLKKTAYKLFDYFANCEYFESEFDYDEVLDLPSPGEKSDPPPPPPPLPGGNYQHKEEDAIVSIAEVNYPGGMKVDGMFFRSFADAAREDPTLAAAVEQGRWDDVLTYVNEKLLNKPNEYYTLDKLRRAVGVDRRATLREILEYVFGLIPRLKSKDELLEEEFAKFVADHKPADAVAVPAIRQYFKAYATSDQLRHIIDAREYTQLHTNPGFTFGDFKAVPDDYRKIVPEYIRDYAQNLLVM